MSKQHATLYMGIDTTDLKNTKIRYIATRQIAVLFGQIYMADHPDRTIIAPPLEGRGFSKLNQKQLQYLIWNTFAIKPEGNYSELVQQALKLALKLEVKHADEAVLTAQLEQSQRRLEDTTSTETKPKREKAAVGDKPKKTSTCGLVWDICEQQLEAHPELTVDNKALRPFIMEACENEGINGSTAAVQYGKWRNSKMSST